MHRAHSRVELDNGMSTCLIQATTVGLIESRCLIMEWIALAPRENEDLESGLTVDLSAEGANQNNLARI